MLIHLRQQLHRLLRQRRGQLLLALCAALWLALPLPASASAEPQSMSMQADNGHCEHHQSADAIQHAGHQGSPHGVHHGSDHNCHCAQTCHTNPLAILVNALSLPPAALTPHPTELPQPLFTLVGAPLYRPPIALAA